MNLQTEQFNSKQMQNAIKGELTHISVHLSLDSRDTDVLHADQFIGVHMNLLAGQFT
jgi:hypothetical protein